VRIGFRFAGPELDIRQSVLAVPELGGDQFLKQRVLSSTGHGYVATVGQRYHAERIIQPLSGGHFARHYGDGTDVQLGRVERQHHGHGVVGTGIGVEDDLLGRRAGGRCHYVQQDDDNQEKSRRLETVETGTFAA
jgi:hypothetical protein